MKVHCGDVVLLDHSFSDATASRLCNHQGIHP